MLSLRASADIPFVRSLRLALRAFPLHHFLALALVAIYL